MTANWLLIETSGRAARLGLARGGAVVGRAELDTSRRHARDMTATIGALLGAAGLKPADLTGVMASRGPGSYTGLRVGLTTAKALAYALGCELRAVDAFAAVAEQAPAEARHQWVIADALQGQVYAQRFARGPDGWRAASVLQILDAGAFAAAVTEGDWVNGPGVEAHAGTLPRNVPLVEEEDRTPQVASVFAVGLRLAPLSREELFGLEPLYLRGSSAEEKANGPRG